MVGTLAKVRLLDPTARAADENHPLARRHTSLRGKRVGILDNTKANADVLMRHIAALLSVQYGTVDLVYRRKVHAAIGATEAVLEELAVSCDLVLLGSGD
jgi:hypothetical protein